MLMLNKRDEEFTDWKQKMQMLALEKCDGYARIFFNAGATPAEQAEYTALSVARRRKWDVASTSSLRNKRPGLSGRSPCKEVAIGVARRPPRLSGERTLRVPPCCSFQSATPADRTSHRSSPVVRACWRG